MTRGERAMLDLKPEYAFQHKDSGLPLPKGLRPEAPVVADVTVRPLLFAVQLTSACCHCTCLAPTLPVMLDTWRVC